MYSAPGRISHRVVLAVDRTVEANAVGTDVVRAAISKIEDSDIFPSDKRLLRRIAYVETADGESPPSSGNNGGIWKVELEDFELTQNDPDLADIRKEINAKFSAEFVSTNVRGWESLAFRDLNRPLWSALAARLLIHIVDKTVDLPTSSDIIGQADFWKMYYNEAGDVEKFRNDVEQLERDESELTPTSFMKGCMHNKTIIVVHHALKFCNAIHANHPTFCLSMISSKNGTHASQKSPNPSVL